MKSVRAFYAGAVIAALLAIWFQIGATNPSLPRGSTIRIALPSVQASVDPQAVAHFDQIVSANIFSRERSTPAPVVRAPVIAHAVPAKPSLTLFGTTVGPHGAVALIQGGPATSGAELHHVGDVIAGARLVSITDSSVTLERSTGPVVLRMQTRRPGGSS